MHGTASGTKLWPIAVLLVLVLLVLVLNGEIGTVAGAVGEFIGAIGKVVGGLIDIYESLGG